jgi:hypothetical protein
MSNFILISVQVQNFMQTQSIEGGGGVETCRLGGGPVEETGGVEAGRWRRASSADGVEAGRWRREAGRGEEPVKEPEWRQRQEHPVVRG